MVKYAKPIITAQLYTVREFMKTPADIEKSLEKVSKMGYTAVQVSGAGEIEPERIREIADKYGLTICATHIKFEQMTDNFDEVVRSHKAMGCKLAGIGGMPASARGSAESFKKFAKDASEVGRKLADNGMRFLYHNHHFEFTKYDGKCGMDILFEESDPRYFDFEIDTYWVQTAGASPLDWINKVAGRMKIVHFKDMAVSNEKDKRQKMAEIGEGNLNWAAIIKACSDNGVDWAAVEQDVCERDPFESLDMSYKYLAGMGLK